MNGTDEFLLILGRRIAQTRREKHLTQEQVAEKMDVSLQTVSCIELGKKAIRPENLAKLCRALDVSADYLLFGERTEKQISGTVALLASLDPEDHALAQTFIARLAREKNSKL